MQVLWDAVANLFAERPTFASAGIVLLGVARALDAPRSVRARFWPWPAHRPNRAVRWLNGLVADRTRTLTCSEFVCRTFERAQVDLGFPRRGDPQGAGWHGERPAQDTSLQLLPGGLTGSVGDRVDQLRTLYGHQPEAASPTWRDAPALVLDFATELPRAIKRRQAEARTGDCTDLLSPGGFERSRNFIPIRGAGPI